MIEEVDGGNRISPVKIVRNSKKKGKNGKLSGLGDRQERKK